MVENLIPEVAVIEGGEFWMGDDSGRPDERPAHIVRLSSFQAGLRPVSNAEYAVFVNATNGTAAPFCQEPDFADPQKPVAGVSWHEATAYCWWLSQKSGIGFRLPTEAEREYAARGGLDSVDWPWGSRAPADRKDLDIVSRLQQPHRPAAECGNAYGLLCMADNLHEWCSDWYKSDYYAHASCESPSGPTVGTRRASRGGSWRHQIKFNRVSARSSLNPSFRYNDYGFRVYADI